MKKNLIYISSLLFVLVIFLFIYRNSDFFKRRELKEKGVHEFVSTADKDDFYENLLFVRTQIGNDEFDTFVKTILNSDHKDLKTLKTMYFVVRYVKEENKKEFICDLTDLKIRLNNDTILDRNYSIFSDVDNAIEKLCSENKDVRCCPLQTPEIY